ncbi:MAG: UDP-N-acetylmuramoyl-L-alanyl-D-glutamate--2,6-diaminopimelate ligase, partial [Pedobacter sp.]
MNLQDLLYGVSIKSLKGMPQVEVAALAFDSRLVNPGTLFFAIRGTAVDGHQFINQTIASGANVIICEELPTELNEQVTYVEVADSSEALG